MLQITRAKDLPEEKSLVQRLLTGVACDPYVIAEIPNSLGDDVARTKVVVSPNANNLAAAFPPPSYNQILFPVMHTSIFGNQPKTRNPRFDERLLLYVQDATRSPVLRLVVMDQNVIEGDNVIGSCVIPLGDTLEENGGLEEQWVNVLDDVCTPHYRPPYISHFAQYSCLLLIMLLTERKGGGQD